jgi:hypothetical protein
VSESGLFEIIDSYGLQERKFKVRTPFANDDDDDDSQYAFELNNIPPYIEYSFPTNDDE